MGRRRNPDRYVRYREDGEWRGIGSLKYGGQIPTCAAPDHVWLLAKNERLSDVTCLCGSFVGHDCPTCAQQWKIVSASASEPEAVAAEAPDTPSGGPAPREGM